MFSNQILSNIFKMENEYDIFFRILIIIFINLVGSLLAFILIGYFRKLHMILYSALFAIILFTCALGFIIIGLKISNEYWNSIAFYFMLIGVLSFGIGLGSLPYVYMTECFKANDILISLSLCLSLNALIGFLFYNVLAILEILVSNVTYILMAYSLLNISIFLIFICIKK